MTSGKGRTEPPFTRPQRFELERARLATRAHNWSQAVKYGGFGFLIACTGVPAYWVYRCMDSLSGETTVLNMNVSIALNAVLGVSTTGLGAVVKYQRNLIKERDREIQKLKLELRAALADVSRIEKPPSV